jgi:hypothetical protein
MSCQRSGAGTPADLEAWALPACLARGSFPTGQAGSGGGRTWGDTSALLCCRKESPADVARDADGQNLNCGGMGGIVWLTGMLYKSSPRTARVATGDP